MIAAYVFAFEHPAGTWHAVTDDTKRLVATQHAHLAEAFIEHLRPRTTVAIHAVTQTPLQIAQLLQSAGHHEPAEAGMWLELIERQHDPEAWARDLATRCPIASRSEATA